MSIRIPPHIDWQTWRIAASPRFSSSLVEIETQWTMTDVHDAHDVLDIYEALDAKAQRQG